MEYELTAEEKHKKIWLEIKDLLAGAAFPLMLMLIFGVSILGFTDSTEELALQIVIIVLGELFLAAAYIVFGRQSGIAGKRRYVQNQKKREIGGADLKARCHTGEYALHKGFLIAIISCIPYIIVQIIGAASPNSVCDFLLKTVFGWAYYPFALSGITPWLNFIWIIPLTCIHAAAYAWGGATEEKKQKKVAELQATEGKKNKK